jgi:putative flippase GtrA
MVTSVKPHPGFLATFSRSQVSAAVATGVDFAVLFGLVEFFGVWYVLSTAIGALAGAVTNFVMNRHWSFEAGDYAWRGQALRYTAVSAGSLALNTGGVYAATDGLGLHYALSVIVVSLLVALVYNYPLQRYFVFKRGIE